MESLMEAEKLCRFATFVATSVGLLSFVVEGYPNGAGRAACSTLRPAHGSPSLGPSPYQIQVLNGATIYTPDTPVTGQFRKFLLN